MTTSTLLTWSDLLRYPGRERSVELASWIERLIAAEPDTLAHLAPLLAFAHSASGGELEELFVRTFENNKERALELGWHLYGENYARGSFMARMRGLLRDLGIKETIELPDHISHILMVLAQGDEALGRALARGVVLPALEKIEQGFTDQNNPYLGVVRGLKASLSAGLGAREEVSCHE